MANKWIALNILLLIAAVGMGRELYQRYEHFKVINDQAKTEPVSIENQAAAKNAPSASVDSSMENLVDTNADYFIISERTLFSETRGNEEMVSVVAPKIAPLNPKPILVGVSRIDGQYTASVRNPAATQARGGQPATETWRVGDSYRGYVVDSIERDLVVLVHPDNSAAREVLPLNRSAVAAQPVRPAGASSAQLVSIGPGGGSSGAITVTTASTASAPGRVAPTAAQNAATARQAAQQQQAKPQQAQAKQQQAKPQQAQQRVPVTVSTATGDVVISVPENVQDIIQLLPGQKPQPGTNANPAQGGRQQPQQRVVPTPFGEIIR